MFKKPVVISGGNGGRRAVNFPFATDYLREDYDGGGGGGEMELRVPSSIYTHRWFGNNHLVIAAKTMKMAFLSRVVAAAANKTVLLQTLLHFQLPVGNSLMHIPAFATTANARKIPADGSEWLSLPPLSREVMVEMALKR